MKDFISTSLQEIIQGVKEAQANANEAGGVIMPPFSGNVLKNEVAAYRREIMRDIEFDVAVTVVEDNEKGISAGAFISVIGISGKEKTSLQNVAVSRIKFTVPVIYPVQK